MGKMKKAVYEHELLEDGVIGKIIQVFMEWEDVNGVFHPSGKIFRITHIEYDPPMQIPSLFLTDKYGNKCMLTTYDLNPGSYRLLPEGKLTETLYD